MTLKETFMIEKANVKNSFTEGLSHKTEILLDEPLRSLPNGVCDEIVDNQLIRRVGKVVLNGSEDWKKGASGEFYVYGKMLDILVDMIHDLSKYGETIFCNIYKQRKVNQESERIKQISVYNHGGTTLGQIRIIEPSCETFQSEGITPEFSSKSTNQDL